MSDRDELDWIRENEPERLKCPQNASIDEIEVSDDWFMELTEIKGIGEETARDIGKIYPTLDALRGAVLDENVPLRNDVVRKLKKYLN